MGALVFATFVFHIVILLAAKLLGPYQANAASTSEEAIRERAFALHGPHGIADDGVPVDLNDEVRGSTARVPPGLGYGRRC